MAMTHASARADYRHWLDLVLELVSRDVKLRYRGSALGMTWSQIGALVQIGTLTFVFSKVVKLGIPHYAAFVFTGMTAWIWFSIAIEGATASVVTNRDLVRRPGFPLALLPVVTVLTPLVHYLLTLPIMLVAIALITGRLPATAVGLPVLLAIQFAVTLGPAYLLAAFNVSLRDTTHLVTVALTLLFYGTPIIYTGFPHKYRLLGTLNPLAQVIRGERALLLEGRIPDLGPLVVVFVAAIVVSVIGYRVFVHLARWFAEDL